MSDIGDIETRIKKILKQSAGNVHPEDGPLIPEVGIKGKGPIFCYSPTQKRFIHVTRGLKAYIINDKEDEMGKILIYTFIGQIIEIDAAELIYTGYD